MFTLLRSPAVKPCTSTLINSDDHPITIFRVSFLFGMPRSGSVALWFLATCALSLNSFETNFFSRVLDARPCFFLFYEYELMTWRYKKILNIIKNINLVTTPNKFSLVYTIYNTVNKAFEDQRSEFLTVHQVTWTQAFFKTLSLSIKILRSKTWTIWKN